MKIEIEDKELIKKIKNTFKDFEKNYTEENREEQMQPFYDGYVESILRRHNKSNNL